MCIYCPVNEVYYSVLYFDNTDALRVEVKRHVFITFDVHECAVHSENRIKKRSILDVPPQALQLRLCHLINYNRAVTIKNEHLSFYSRYATSSSYLSTTLQNKEHQELCR